jgi:hypothetical protein
MRTEPAFSYIGPGAPSAAFEVLGVWTAVPSPAPVAVAFGGNPAVAAPPIWRTSFPAGPAAALALVGAGEARVETLERAIPAALDRLGGDLEAWIEAMPPGLADRAPEQRLAALLAAARDPSDVPAFGPGGSASFGVLDSLTRPLQDALDWVRRTLLHYAWVETLIDGRNVARSVVGWSGDFSTCWRAGLDEAAVALHLRGLDMARRSRDAIVRTLTAAMQVALKIAALLALPGGAWLTLPMAWTLLKRLLADLARVTGS